MCEIVNTLQFRFPIGSPRPSYVEIAAFLKQLNVDPKLMETAYKTANDRSLFVKFITREAMMESLGNNSEVQKFTYSSSESVEVRMCIAGTNMHYVRVFDLPPELGDNNLSQALEPFGKVERIVREKFPAGLGLDHLYTGVRGVYIDVKQDIPPSVDVGNRKGRIFYYGLKDTCFLCRGVGHRKDACPQNTNRREKKTAHLGTSNPSSYAGVLSGMEYAEKSPGAAEDEIVEILEEEEIGSMESLEGEKQSPVFGKATESDKEMRQKKAREELEEMAKAVQEVMANSRANQRRAEFAASRSSSGSGSAPRKKCVRRTLY